MQASELYLKPNCLIWNHPPPVINLFTYLSSCCNHPGALPFLKSSKAVCFSSKCILRLRTYSRSRGQYLHLTLTYLSYNYLSFHLSRIHSHSSAAHESCRTSQRTLDSSRRIPISSPRATRPPYHPHPTSGNRTRGLTVYRARRTSRSEEWFILGP